MPSWSLSCQRITKLELGNEGKIDFTLAATSGKTVTDLLEEGMLQRACAGSIEIIGEATNNVSFALRKA